MLERQKLPRKCECWGNEWSWLNSEELRHSRSRWTSST